MTCVNMSRHAVLFSCAKHIKLNMNFFFSQHSLALWILPQHTDLQSSYFREKTKAHWSDVFVCVA